MKLIEKILKIKGPSHLCDEIQRDEDFYYVGWSLEKNILQYIPKIYFNNKRILDFGCGSGASTMIIARMVPKSQIVGIDIESKFLSIANLRAQFYGFNNVRFILSSNNEEFPKNLGKFDFIIFNAVYEHLLPDERKKILLHAWTILKKKGVLFINETPNRYYPIENHTTNLPLINYFPDRVAYALAIKWDKTIKAKTSWEVLLRRGIRGATKKEIMKILNKNVSTRPILLKPNNLEYYEKKDFRQRIINKNIKSPGLVKVIINAKILKNFINKITGDLFLPNISLAYFKKKL